MTEEGAKALGAFDRRQDSMILTGVVDCEVNEVVSLAHDLGQARLHPTLNVLSEAELITNYYQQYEGVNGPYPHRLIYTHKQNRTELIFTRHPEVYGDVFWNLDFDWKTGKPIAASSYRSIEFSTCESTAEQEQF